MFKPKKQTGFQPRIVGQTFFAANGNRPGAGDLEFRIIQVSVKGSCIVEHKDAEGIWQKQNHTGSIEKAWSSIRYQAGITFYTQRSLGAPETDKLIKAAAA